jgi:MOSC domain-containing protein YiiM
MQGHVARLGISKGGVPKLSVPAALAGPLGLEGDEHAHPRFHGGPLKALLLISSEDLDSLRARGYEVVPGDLGENLTISSLDFRHLRPGMRFRAGQAVIELTTLRVPCSALDRYNSPGVPERIQDVIYDSRVKAGDPASPRWGLAGFYASVEIPGLIQQGDIISLLDQPV